MSSTPIIQTLQNKALFSHPVTQFDVIETHLSWVLLTGSFAYKIKKPVNLGFQDFTTLDKRKLYCEKEFLLNRRLAPDLYCDVIPITGTPRAPSLSGEGTPIEYAIKMHQFDQQSLLSQKALRQELSIETIDAIVSQVVRFHQHTETALGDSPYGQPSSVWAPMEANFRALESLSFPRSLFSDIEDWAFATYQGHRDLLSQRKAKGWIRACHGDLHLGNIVLMNKNPVIFDCIEFNESLRWIDVINDMAFLGMDLAHYNLHSLSYYAINRYSELMANYEGIPLLRLYQCYRAMVRAKVAGFQQQQDDLNTFLSLARHFTQSPSPTLTITVGVSGSGKTYHSQSLFMKTGAIRLRSDVFRLHLFGSKPDRYSEETTRTVYATLANQAKTLLEAGYSVIIDAACLKRWQRDLFFSLATGLNVPFHILALEAPLEVLQQRLDARESTRHDFSEATQAVLAQQMKEKEPLSEAEIGYLLKV